MTAFLLIVLSALSLPGQTPAPWNSLSNIAKQRYDADDFKGAEQLRREALRLAEDKLGSVDTQLVALLDNLALSLHFAGRGAEAEPLVRRALAIAEVSADKKLIALTLNALGVVLTGEGEMARAEPVLRRSVALLEQTEGPDTLDVAKAVNNLSTLYADAGQYSKAEHELARVLPVYEKHLGPEDPALALALGNMFTIFYQQHRPAEGEPYLRRALAIGEKKFPNSLNMANLTQCLAALEVSHENYKQAARLLERAMTIQERLLGPGHPSLGRSLVNYSIVLRCLHQKHEAKQALNRANSILRRT